MSLSRCPAGTEPSRDREARAGPPADTRSTRWLSFQTLPLPGSSDKKASVTRAGLTVAGSGHGRCRGQATRTPSGPGGTRRVRIPHQTDLYTNVSTVLTLCWLASVS